MSYKAASLTKFLLLGATCAPLFLAACTTDNGPYPMPSGYAHHSDVYKAPDGPEMTAVAAARPAPNTMPVPMIQNEELVVRARVETVTTADMNETINWDDKSAPANSRKEAVYQTNMEHTDTEILRARELEAQQKQELAKARVRAPQAVVEETWQPAPIAPPSTPMAAEAELEVSASPAGYDSSVARPRTTAMSQRLGGASITSQSSAYTAAAPYEDRYETSPTPMSLSDDNSYGSSAPVPLTSATDDR